MEVHADESLASGTSAALKDAEFDSSSMLEEAPVSISVGDSTRRSMPASCSAHAAIDVRAEGSWCQHAAMSSPKP